MPSKPFKRFWSVRWISNGALEDPKDNWSNESGPDSYVGLDTVSMAYPIPTDYKLSSSQLLKILCHLPSEANSCFTLPNGCWCSSPCSSSHSPLYCQPIITAQMQLGPLWSSFYWEGRPEIYHSIQEFYWSSEPMGPGCMAGLWWTCSGKNPRRKAGYTLPHINSVHEADVVLILSLC